MGKIPVNKNVRKAFQIEETAKVKAKAQRWDVTECVKGIV